MNIMNNPGTNYLSTKQTLDVYAGSMSSNDVQELRNATAAFLTDRYESGTYVANLDDIADLQKATAAFLANRADRECLCLDPAGSGLLLPGEQFLLPVSTAVNRVRSTSDAAVDIVNLIDEYLGAQLTCEDAPDTPLLDAAVEAVEANTVERTPLDDVLGLKSLLRTYKHEEQRLPSRDITLEDLLNLPNEMDRLLTMYEDTDKEESGDDDNSEAATDDADAAFDAPHALCHSQASNAASFFDPVTETIVPYASLDQLLELDDRDSHAVYIQEARVDEADLPVDEDDGRVDEMICADGDDIFVCLDDIDAVCSQFPIPPTIRPTEHGLLSIITCLPTIWEEYEPCSAASNSSMNFAERRGFLKSLESRRGEFLDDEEELLQDDSGIGGLDRLFADDIWTNTPGLGLALPVSQTRFAELVDNAELELQETLTAVFKIVRAHSWTDVPTSGAELKRRLHLSAGDFRASYCLSAYTSSLI